MKSFTAILFSFLFLMGAKAQVSHFIYIQTEDKQPFYVKLKEKIHSSTGSGYLVLSQLQEDTVQLHIGFPKNEWPAQEIPVILKNKDAGFSLKNFGKEGWGLFNLQTMEVLKPSPGLKEAASTSVPTGDALSAVLADVVNKPAIGQTEVAKPDSLSSIPAKEPIQIIHAPVASVSKASITTNVVARLYAIKEGNGLKLAYADKGEQGTDTIDVFIPEPQTEVQKTIPAQSTSANLQSSLVDSTSNIKAELKNPKPQVVAANAACKQVASETDLARLQRKIAAWKDVDQQMAVAKKAFQAKCYSTEQVKSLSSLFNSDETKYHFFDIVNLRVSDPANFHTLESLLSDPYYITRFKAMLR
jgi:hypothetical protein